MRRDSQAIHAALRDAATRARRARPTSALLLLLPAQGGDVVDGSGKNMPAQLQISDETFAVKHDAPGIVGLSNNGLPHTATTQVGHSSRLQYLARRALHSTEFFF